MDSHQIQRPPLSTTNNTPHLPAIPSRTANSTPISSPGLFSPINFRSNAFPPYSASDVSTPGAVANSPYLHPLQSHRVRETHKALVDLDSMTGRKLINQYEVIEELGRGVHGKVKLARNLETGESVAIKIIPRFSKTRRLGKVTASPQDKTKREIAILKKIRHPNVVALLEIIDDPELSKIYVVLEHVELGEVVWRKKGLPLICSWERRMVQKGMYGGELTSTDEEERERYIQLLERRRAVNELKRAKMQETQRGPGDFWSIEYGAANEEDYYETQAYDFALDGEHTAQPSTAVPSVSQPGSRAASITRFSTRSTVSGSCAVTPLPSEYDGSSIDADADAESEAPSGSRRSKPGSSTALDGTMYGAYTEDVMLRGRSPSMADSIISHMSSIDFNSQPEDPFSDDFSYVPCFTIEEARATFRDTVLGLEYLHYEGVVHRDIKPANLLWTKDHRVKISDFGVSYFGRPIREGEPDELVSESEARDFDDDLELAKTVGTPAFFAPELCYTDVDHEQPKISEQIDVWSLGVTLYCLIFARIPFMAEDEFQMFKKIAKEEVYIPRRRLRPVDPQHSPSSTSFYKRVNNAPYRDDTDLAYEEVDDDLYDLLREMLTKNPEKRIRLKDVKRHPWVVADIEIPVTQWINETDPSRRFSGRKIEVDEREIKRAVVPLTLMERARSVVKKAVSKVMHGGRADKAETHQSRRRAASSAASSAGDTPPSMSPFPHFRDMRRKSIRPDDYFATVRESEHPLSQSVSATPHGSPTGERPGSPRRHLSPPASDLNLVTHDSTGMFGVLPGLGAPVSSSTSLPSGRGLVHHRHMRIKSVSNSPVTLAHVKESQTTPAGPAMNGPTDDPVSPRRKTRDIRTQDDPTRSKSVDRGLFANEDKRAEPSVAISTAMAPGSIELPTRPMSVDPGCATNRLSLVSPIAPRVYQRGHANSDSNMHEKHVPVSDFERRPVTPYRIMQIEGKTPPPRVYNSSTTESFARAQQHIIRQQIREADERAKQESTHSKIVSHIPPCPPSPYDVIKTESPQPPSRVHTAGTLATSIAAYTGNSCTPLTSPTAMTSPISIENLPQHIFRSDPSLPALLSGASSVSADAEGDFLLRPGSLDSPSLIDTTDSLTPPALGKEPVQGFPLRVDEQYQTLLPRARHEYSSSTYLPPNVADDDEGSDTDSDGGIIMAKPKRRVLPKEHTSFPMAQRVANPKRRDTQTSITSIGSTETAKKIATVEPWNDAHDNHSVT